MANENMIKFLRGNVANLPQTATSGALYFTKDEGIYLGMEDGSYHRYGDFITVADVNSLPTTGAHETCMYYCTSENILARYDSEKGWIQINKQPTAEELKGLLGLGSLAYKSEVAEGDLNADLKAKIDASTAVNHSHANKDLLDTYTQTEADLADAVAKKHAHANAEELAKIVDGDKAKWDAVAADHLTSADKTALENSIKEAKQAGTDANTNIETYKVTNDARVLAVEEDIAEITDAENGVLAQAKSYSDGKLATARTEITAEIDADVKVVADDLAGYKISNDAAVALKANAADVVANDTFESFKTANTQAIADAKAGAVSDIEAKGYAVATEVAGTYATKTELGNVDAKFADYVTSASYTTDKAAIDKAIEDEAKARGEADADFETRIAALEDNFGDGEGTVEAQIAAAVKAEEDARKEAVAGVQGEVDAVEGRMDTAEGKIADLETASATHAIKTEVEGALALKADKSALEETDATLAEVKQTVDNFFAEDAAINDTIDTLKEIANYIATDKEGAADITARVGALEGKVDVDKVSTAISTAVEAEVTRATGVEEGLAGRIKDLEDNKAGYATTGEVATAKQEAIDAAATDAQGKVDALANGQVKVNTEAIATKANAADVYAKTETFTKDEVNAAIAAAVEQAHQWGEF